MENNLIKCRFLGEDGQPKGKEYSYFCDIEVNPGDKVVVLNPRGQETDVMVTEINVPLETVEAFKDKVKHVVRNAIVLEAKLVHPNFGTSINIEDAKALQVGASYEVATVDMGQSNTIITLKNIAGSFNSVQFEFYRDGQKIELRDFPEYNPYLRL